MTKISKELIIVGGANGSGKTTFAKPYVAHLNSIFLNADELTKEFELAGESEPLVKAGRKFFQLLEAYLSQSQSFVVETTLSGSYINKVAQKAKDLGYKVTLIYIFLDSDKLCVERVKQRVLKGGHDVPTEAIIRRYYRSKTNFWKNFRTLAHKCFLIYNGLNGFQEVAIYTEKTEHILNTELLEKFKQHI